MAVDDDIDSLEEELEGLDGGGGDSRRALIMRFLPAILPVGALLILLVVVFTVYSGDDEAETMIIKDLATAPGSIKIEPESGGAPVPVEGQDNPAYNPMNQGSDDTQVAKITPPPEEPLKPGEESMIKVPPPEVPPAAGAEGQVPAPTDPKAPAAVPAGGDVAKTEGKDPGKPENLVAGAGDAQVGEPAESAEMKPPETAESKDTKVPEPKPETQTAQAGTVVKPPPATKKAPAPSPRTGAGTTAFRTMAGVYRVQIASAKSEGQAQREWTTQVSKYPDVLSNLSLTVQRAVVKDRGTFYRVQGGPFQDRTAADSVCRKLKSRGQDCLVVRP